MLLQILRALFVLLMGAVGYFYLSQISNFWGGNVWMLMAGAVTVGVLLVCIDILSPRKKLAVFSGTFLGLIVGIAIAYALSFVVHLLVEQFVQPTTTLAGKELEKFLKGRDMLEEFIDMGVGVATCYLSISFIFQTKDDFRFVIPYVEFSKQTKGARPILLDTSVLIDGRINDIADSGILESQLIVPRFVLNELQQVADSSDKLKRNRGRRGLDMLSQLQSNSHTEVILYDSSGQDEPGVSEVDQKLMHLAKRLRARVMTTDFNLNKVAQLRGVDVININDLANALKPVVMAGEKMQVRLTKAGDQPGQAVGYLDDGTMVVVEQARPMIGQEIEFTVRSVHQTSAGRMIFGRVGEDGMGKKSVTSAVHSS